MQIIEIFLASSNELQEDRKEFEVFINRINQDWVLKNVFFKLVIWENFVDAMSKEGLQKEYNKAIQKCDLFILLFFTKVGQFTNEEFEAAFGSFKKNQRPIIYTYFKDDLISTSHIGDEILTLLEFKKTLKKLKHYYTSYRSPEELKWKFSRQLEKLYGKKEISNFDIDEKTTQSEIDTIALTLTNQLLSNSSIQIDNRKLNDAITKSTDWTQHSIFLLTSRWRKAHWENNKHLMEKTIPVFRALIECDHRKDKYYYYGQLGYALKDKKIPNWGEAKDNFDIAINMLGKSASHYFFYDFNRAICRIHMDEKYNNSEPSNKESVDLIIADLKSFKRSRKDILDTILMQEHNLAINRWLRLNKVKVI